MKYLLLRGALNKNSLVLDKSAKKQQIRSNILFLKEKNSLNNLGSQFKFLLKHIGIIPTVGLMVYCDCKIVYLFSKIIYHFLNYI